MFRRLFVSDRLRNQQPRRWELPPLEVVLSIGEVDIPAMIKIHGVLFKLNFDCTKAANNEKEKKRAQLRPRACVKLLVYARVHETPI